MVILFEFDMLSISASVEVREGVSPVRDRNMLAGSSGPSLRRTISV